jgi:hypothetical protein
LLGRLRIARQCRQTHRSGALSAGRLFKPAAARKAASHFVFSFSLSNFFKTRPYRVSQAALTGT